MLLLLLRNEVQAYITTHEYGGRLYNYLTKLKMGWQRCYICTRWDATLGCIIHLEGKMARRLELAGL